MDTRAAKRIPITEYLSALGHEPAAARGADRWYLSPLRGERTPSFKVDSVRNVWYDHGEGVGGTIVDLAMRLAGGAGVSEALRDIGRAMGRGFVPAAAPKSAEKAPARPRGTEIEFVGPLTDAGLIRYLVEERAIPYSVAAPFVRHIRYRTPEGKTYESIAFANRSGGYEHRNARFKGSAGPKDFTLVGDPRGGEVRVFEGFSDFLSAQALWPEERERPALVLNSVALAGRAAEELLARGCGALCLFDADQGGDRAMARFRETLGEGKVSDARARLEGRLDVNELLVSRRDAR